MKNIEWMPLIGSSLVICGIAFIYWPAALIVAGFFMLRGWAKMRKDKDARAVK